MATSMNADVSSSRGPRTRLNGNGTGAGLRATVATVQRKATELTREQPERLAKGLGWFSIGLGLAQLAMPDRVARMAGVEPTEDNLRLMRSLGLRELSSGVGILTQPMPDKWLWSRVVGDVMDLALLGAAMGGDKTRKSATVGATLAVLGVTGLDILAAREIQRKRRELTDAGEEIGSKTIFRIITVKAHPANVENDWNEWVWAMGGDESREATVTFQQAPGAQGTEIRAELTHTPRMGKLGSAALRMTHKSPGQMLGQDLKHFKMMVETGEVVKSDASVHKHMHPAQPDDSVGNANLIQEAQ